jgi:hypothetical protein
VLKADAGYSSTWMFFRARMSLSAPWGRRCAQVPERKQPNSALTASRARAASASRQREQVAFLTRRQRRQVIRISDLDAKGRQGVKIPKVVGQTGSERLPS